jgi:hypothetical protein
MTFRLEGKVKYRCRYCPYETRLKPDVEKHYNCKHHPNPTIYPCTYCTYGSTRKENLKRHVEQQHVRVGGYLGR